MPYEGYATPVATQHYVAPGGQTYSQYTSHVPAGSVLTPNGYDVCWEDGTVGRGHPPFETMALAEDYARGWNAKRRDLYARLGRTPPPLPPGAPA